MYRSIDRAGIALWHKGDAEERERLNFVTNKMMDRFQEENGSYICNDLLGCDMSAPEGVQYARENGLFVDFCPTMVASAVDILEEIILAMKEFRKKFER